MATILSTKTSGVGGLSVTGDASGVLQLASADGTTALTIDASQNVGIGTSSPGANLHVVNSTTAILNYPTGTWAAKIYQQADTPAYNGLVVGNRWQADSSTVFEAGSLYGGGSAWASYYKITGLGTHIWGSVIERMRLDSSGSLILAGSTAQKATGTTWSNPSDSRLKDNVVLYTKGLNELMQVTVKEWEYNGKGGTSKGLKGLGVIADEVMLILPNTVENYKAKLNEYDKEDSDIKKFDATEITWLMLKSIQELKTIIDTQNARIDALEAK